MAETKTDLMVIKEYFGMDAKAAMLELRVQTPASEPDRLTQDERTALANGIRNGSLTY